jgi:hypothetical protein
MTGAAPLRIDARAAHVTLRTNEMENRFEL